MTSGSRMVGRRGPGRLPTAGRLRPAWRAWREIDEEQTDRETVFTDLMDGRYSSPVRVIAFNTAEAGRATCRKTSPTRSRGAAPWMDVTFRHSLRALSLATVPAGRPMQLPLPLRGVASDSVP